MDGTPPKSRIHRHHHRFTIDTNGGDSNLREHVLYSWSPENQRVIDEFAKRVPPPSALMPEFLYQPARGQRKERKFSSKKPLIWEVVEEQECLSAIFTEWIMGLPEGWVTDVEGLNRKAVFELLGNGVVPAQLALALNSAVNPDSTLF